MRKLLFLLLISSFFLATMIGCGQKNGDDDDDGDDGGKATTSLTATAVEMGDSDGSISGNTKGNHLSSLDKKLLNAQSAEEQRIGEVELSFAGQSIQPKQQVTIEGFVDERLVRYAVMVYPSGAAQMSLVYQDSFRFFSKENETVGIFFLDHNKKYAGSIQFAPKMYALPLQNLSDNEIRLGALTVENSKDFVPAQSILATYYETSWTAATQKAFCSHSSFFVPQVQQGDLDKNNTVDVLETKPTLLQSEVVWNSAKISDDGQIQIPLPHLEKVQFFNTVGTEEVDRLSVAYRYQGEIARRVLPASSLDDEGTVGFEPIVKNEKPRWVSDKEMMPLSDLMWNGFQGGDGFFGSYIEVDGEKKQTYHLQNPHWSNFFPGSAMIVPSFYLADKKIKEVRWNWQNVENREEITAFAIQEVQVSVFFGDEVVVLKTAKDHVNLNLKWAEVKKVHFAWVDSFGNTFSRAFVR